METAGGAGDAEEDLDPPPGELTETSEISACRPRNLGWCCAAGTGAGDDDDVRWSVTVGCACACTRRTAAGDGEGAEDAALSMAAPGDAGALSAPGGSTRNELGLSRSIWWSLSRCALMLGMEAARWEHILQTLSPLLLSPLAARCAMCSFWKCAFMAMCRWKRFLHAGHWKLDWHLRRSLRDDEEDGHDGEAVDDDDSDSDDEDEDGEEVEAVVTLSEPGEDDDDWPPLVPLFCCRSCMMRLAYSSEVAGAGRGCFSEVGAEGGEASERRLRPPRLRSTEPLHWPAVAGAAPGEAAADVGTTMPRLWATGGLLRLALSRGVLLTEQDDDDEAVAPDDDNDAEEEDEADVAGGGGDDDSACSSGLSISPDCRVRYCVRDDTGSEVDDEDDFPP